MGKDVLGEFKKVLDLSKRQQLRQVLILNDLGFFNDALKICDELFEIHFAVDDFYISLINAKMYARGELNLDVSSLQKLLDML